MPASDRTQQVERDVRAAYEALTARSRALHERAQKTLPGGDTRTGTFFAPYPPFIVEGSGCRIRDADGNEYVDFLNNFTSLVHGHAHPHVVRAATEQLSRGTAQAAPIEGQLLLAEHLQQRMPSLERIRFVNSGTEAVLQALRAARAFTGRPLIVKMEGGYHGTHDATEVSVDTGSGVPAWPTGEPDVPGLMPGTIDHVLVVPFNDLGMAHRIVGRHATRIAALIVEPVLHQGGIIPAETAFLEGLRALTRHHGILLVLDEIVTFRLARGGAQEFHGAPPDLTVLGKTIGGGFPVGAFGGRADVMDLYDPRRTDRIAHSGTFNGNPVTMAAGLAALELLTQERIRHIDELGGQLAGGFQDALDRAGIGACVTRAGSLAQIHLTEAPPRDARAAAGTDRRLRALLHLALVNRGVFCGSRLNFNISTPMSPETVVFAVHALSEALAELKEVLPVRARSSLAGVR